MRANQTYYHGTDAGYKDAILRDGLIPQAGKGGDAWAKSYGVDYGFGPPPDAMLQRTPSVFLSTDLFNARKFAAVSAQVNGDDTGVIFEIRITQEIARQLKHDEETAGAYRFEGVIPAKYISVWGILHNVVEEELN